MQYNGWDREYLENKESYYKLFDKIMQQDNEKNVEFLEKRVALLANREYGVAVNSATDALYFSLKSYNIGTGDEVLVSDFSWISSASCINMTGASPVFCDIDLESYHISFEEIKKKTTSKTKAIIYTHLFGNMVDVSHILEYCKNNNIIFIEDAAQSLGSSLNGIVAGSIGDISSFSFNNNKVIAGISGGGIVVTNNKDVANYVKKIRRHGKDKDFEMLGYNSKMFYFNAAVIDFRLDKLKEWQLRRQDIARRYNDEFIDLPINIQIATNGLNHNYHKYVVRFEDEISRNLAKEKLNASVHYDKTISENSLYKSVGCTNAKQVSRTVLSLPIHPWLKNEEVEKIINIMWLVS